MSDITQPDNPIAYSLYVYALLLRRMGVQRLEIFAIDPGPI